MSSAFITEVDSVTAEQWSALIDQFADANLYQTWPYGEIRWGRKALSHLVVRRDGEVVAMAQLRLTPGWRLGAGVAYLRWGPLIHRRGTEPDAAVVGAVAEALHETYVRRRGLFLRILPSAFQATPRAALLDAAFSRFQREPFAPGQTYRTMVLDLAPSLEDLRKGLDQKWRNQLNRAEKNGLQVVTGTEDELFGKFARLYEEMLARKKFETSTELNDYVRLQPLLPAHQRVKILICEQGGTPLAGAIATAMGDTGIYLFGATSDEGMKSKGAYLLQWEIVKWLKESGIRYYNLGGINPDTNPGVYHFKAGLSGADVLYSCAFVGCESLLSRALIRGGLWARGGWRKLLAKRHV